MFGCVRDQVQMRLSPAPLLERRSPTHRDDLTVPAQGRPGPTKEAPCPSVPDGCTVNLQWTSLSLVTWSWARDHHPTSLALLSHALPLFKQQADFVKNFFLKV